MPTATQVSIQKDDATKRTAKMANNPSAGGTKGLFFAASDSLVLSIDTGSFGSGAKFKSITFFPTSDESGTASGTAAIVFAGTDRGTKTTTIAGRRTAGGAATNMFSVSWTPTDTTQPVAIADVEGGPNTDAGWFAVIVTDSSGVDWTMDPELVNTSGGSSSTGWQPARPATMVQMIAT